MDPTQLTEASKRHLEIVLSFFPRVDAKASLLIGVNAGMLALLASNAPPSKSLEGYMMFAVVPVTLIAGSLYHLYLESFPQLKGSQQSLIYFREVAGRTESNFVTEFTNQQYDAYTKDLLSQVWHNSAILDQKYDHLRSAFILFAWSVLPWAASLAMFAAKNTELKALLTK